MKNSHYPRLVLFLAVLLLLVVACDTPTPDPGPVEVSTVVEEKKDEPTLQPIILPTETVPATLIVPFSYLDFAKEVDPPTHVQQATTPEYIRTGAVQLAYNLSPYFEQTTQDIRKIMFVLPLNEVNCVSQMDFDSLRIYLDGVEYANLRHMPTGCETILYLYIDLLDIEGIHQLDVDYNGLWWASFQVGTELQ